MRLDRFISLGLVHPLRRACLAGADPGLPILMYHSISDDPEPGLPAYYKVNTSPAVFREHIGFLARQGYRSIELTKVVDLLQRGTPLPQKAVVITFDDGFRNFYREAFPVLRQQDFTATVFLPTAFIQSARQTFKGKECLTWAEVRELRKCGIRFGSHTVSHPQLIELSWKEIEHELSASKKELERQLGEPITAFAHPYAFPQTERQYVRELRSLLAGAGYSCCATTQIGRLRAGVDSYCLKRLPMNSLDDAALFRAKLEGDYDWLAQPQAMVKMLKPLVFGSRKRGYLPVEPAPASLNS